LELVSLIKLVFTIIYVAILARIILSMIIPAMGGQVHPIVLNIADLLNQITEPILGPIRRVLPTVGMLDFSPLVAIILLQVIQWVVIRSLG
jgi:YggT family protein